MRNFTALLLGTLAVGVLPPAYAEPIFDNGMPTRTTGGTFFTLIGDPRPVTIAEDFSVPNLSLLTSLTFWTQGITPTNLDLTYTFYGPGGSAIPGPTLDSRSVTGLSGTPSGPPAGTMWAVDLVEPFRASADVQYWLSLEIDGDPDALKGLGWQFTSPGKGSSPVALIADTSDLTGVESDQWLEDVFGGPMAFQLSGEVPLVSPVFLIALGIPGLIYARSQRARVHE